MIHAGANPIEALQHADTVEGHNHHGRNGAFGIAQFSERFPAEVVSSNGTHLNLAAVVRAQLEDAGVASARIAESGECTLGDMERYYSYRGEGAGTGRLISFIGLGPDVE